jgi:hypothetical protein
MQRGLRAIRYRRASLGRRELRRVTRLAALPTSDGTLRSPFGDSLPRKPVLVMAHSIPEKRRSVDNARDSVSQ